MTPTNKAFTKQSTKQNIWIDLNSELTMINLSNYENITIKEDRTAKRWDVALRATSGFVDEISFKTREEAINFLVKIRSKE